MVAVTVSEARATLPQILDQVEAGEEVVVTRHGREVAVLIRPDTLRARRAGPALERADRLLEQLEEDRRKPLPKRGLSREYAEALVAEIREGRDSR